MLSGLLLSTPIQILIHDFYNVGELNHNFYCTRVYSEKALLERWVLSPG